MFITIIYKYFYIFAQWNKIPLEEKVKLKVFFNRIELISTSLAL